MFEVTQAKREASPVLAAFIGQSGSGKTLSALLMMRGIVGPDGKIVVIDTEGKRALIYADDPEVGGFYHIDFVGPYSSDRFREALKAAIDFGADGVIIDSASHEHEAEGGMLDFADSEERRMSNNPRKSVAKWIKPKMAHGRFITAARSAPAHIIFCIREKTIVDVDSKPAKEIHLPVCDRDLPFEMALTIRLEPETHAATFVKVPKPFQAHVRDGQVVTVEHGRLLMQEAGKGEKVDATVAKIISELEVAAASGPDALTEAYKDAWKKNGPADNTVINPVRGEMQKHADRLKRIAADRPNEAPAPEPEPGDIGPIQSAVPPNFDKLEPGSDEPQF